MNFPRIILILLCIITAVMYARVLLPPEPRSPSPEAVQGTEEQTSEKLKPLPPEQMDLVTQALAPEMTPQAQ